MLSSVVVVATDHAHHTRHVGRLLLGVELGSHGLEDRQALGIADAAVDLANLRLHREPALPSLVERGRSLKVLDRRRRFTEGPPHVAQPLFDERELLGQFQLLGALARALVEVERLFVRVESLRLRRGALGVIEPLFEIPAACEVIGQVRDVSVEMRGVELLQTLRRFAGGVGAGGSDSTPRGAPRGSCRE